VERRAVSIDFAGALTLTIGLVVLLLAVLEGGHSFPWGSWQILALLGAAAGLLALFALAEGRAKDPMVPFRAFRIPVVAVSSVGNVAMGVSMYGLLSYVPLFAQGVQGQSASGASAVLTPMLLGWSVSALVSGRLYVRIGFRNTALLGATLLAAGSAPLVLLRPDSALLLMSATMGVCGLGFGALSPAFLLGPQSAVPWNLRGAVTSSVQFFRTMGGAIGVALLGAVMNSRLASGLPSGISAGEADQLVNALVNVDQRATLPAELVASLSLAMADGLRLVYLALLLMAVFGLAQVVVFARSPAPSRQETPGPEPAMELAG